MNNLQIKSIIISIGGSLLASVIFYVFTLDIILAGFFMLILTISTLVTYAIWRYYSVCRLLGIKSAGIRTKEDWNKHFSNSKKIRVFFTRGGAVLGTDTDPMYQNVKGLPANWDGEIQVLILNPNSRFIVDRAHELDLEVNIVREQCRNVMKNVNRLRERHHVNIIGAYYDSKPFLRFTLFDDFGFFSYPAWGAKYRPYSYHFKIKPGGKSLYEALSIYFDQLWETSKRGDSNE